MKYLKIQDQQIPRIGFGTWQMEGDEAYDGVRDALDLGYRHIDTAQAYENEEQVGRALANSSVERGDVFLTTKVWRTNLRGDDVRSSVEESLKKLQTDYVDLLLIHWPSDDVPVQETLGVMSELKEEGKARLLGVSNFTPSLVEKALEYAPIACNQVEYHPYLDQSRLVRQATENNMMLTAYSPLARQGVVDDETLAEIANRYDKSPAQVSLRWLIQQPSVAAIPKASSSDHRRQNLEIFDFELTEDEMSEISALAESRRIIDPDWAPSWAT